METVLVTGGAGFIGSHVVDALIGNGYRVIVVDDLSTGKKENVNPKAVFYCLDICTPYLDELFTKEKIDWVNHHAAQIDVRRSVADPRRDAQVNICGLLNLLENCLRHRVKGVVFASSGGVIYGEPNDLPVTESHSKGPLSPYGVSKLSSEYYLYYFNRIHGLPYIAMRYGNVYGPRQDPNGEAGVVAIFAGMMLAKKKPTIFGNGKQMRDYIFVEDVAIANLLALKRLADLPQPSSINDNSYNIGTGVGTSVNDLFARLKEIIGFNNDATHSPGRKGELERMFLDISKAQRELLWKPYVSLFVGLTRTVDSFRADKTYSNSPRNEASTPISDKGNAVA